MKNIFLFALIVGTIAQGCSQKNLPAKTNPVGSLDNTITTLYSVISGEKGQERDWDLFRSLFTPDAKLIPLYKSEEKGTNAMYLTPQDYIDKSGNWLVENGFFEMEISRRIDMFGNMAHVFSTYESYHSMKDSQPFMRGINSIQMMNDGTRWWIVNIYWMQENPSNPIPEEYLPLKH